jgi:C-terminal processing protease CtpA/Prc
MTFSGKTYLLTSHRTNSAAVVFAAIFKHNRLGTIVGQETGGRERFMSDPIFVELPNTTLRAQVPVAILELPGNNPGRGVLPDVEVKYSIEDYVAGRDRHLEAVRDLIRRDRESS